MSLSVVETLMISFIAVYSITQVHEGRVLGDSYEHGQKQFYAP